MEPICVVSKGIKTNELTHYTPANYSVAFLNYHFKDDAFLCERRGDQLWGFSQGKNVGNYNTMILSLIWFTWVDNQRFYNRMSGWICSWSPCFLPQNFLGRSILSFIDINNKVGCPRCVPINGASIFFFSYQKKGGAIDLITNKLQ